MRLLTSLETWTAAFFTTLGLAPFVACAGTTIEHQPSSGVRCKNPKPRVGLDGSASGLVDCEGGSTVRVVPVECATTLPRPDRCSPQPGFACDQAGGINCGCLTDADCTDKPNGHCGTGGQVAGCYCSYGCRKDADCESGMLCLCGDPVGRCVPATCKAKSDCSGRNECLSYVPNPGCSDLAFACETENDTCASDADCDGNVCSLEGSAHHCKPINCVVGRPFLLGGAARVADAVRREDWTSGLVPNVTHLGAGARETLARHFTEMGLMEHASIAAFARFTLDALSLGAPPELLMLSQAAMADETAHARDAFALASAYAGASVGPSAFGFALGGGDALTARSPLDIVETTILEGCIGETVAAVEAAEALAHATDPAVREALTRVVADETRHAELAWRFVKWALGSTDRTFAEATARKLVETVEAEAGAASGAESARRDTRDDELCAHGVLGNGERLEIRRRAIREIVLPCARALAATAERRETDAHVLAAA